MNEIFHVEMRSSNPKATAAFLKSAFGWQVTETPNPDFVIFDTSGGFEGHIGPVPEADNSPSAINYIKVEDIAEAEARIGEAGAKILGTRQEAPGMGFYTYFESPGGILMVLWQDA